MFGKVRLLNVFVGFLAVACALSLSVRYRSYLLLLAHAVYHVMSTFLSFLLPVLSFVPVKAIPMMTPYLALTFRYGASLISSLPALTPFVVLVFQTLRANEMVLAASIAVVGYILEARNTRQQEIRAAQLIRADDQVEKLLVPINVNFHSLMMTLFGFIDEHHVDDQGGEEDAADYATMREIRRQGSAMPRVVASRSSSSSSLGHVRPRRASLRSLISLGRKSSLSLARGGWSVRKKQQQQPQTDPLSPCQEPRDSSMTDEDHPFSGVACSVDNRGGPARGGTKPIYKWAENWAWVRADGLCKLSLAHRAFGVGYELPEALRDAIARDSTSDLAKDYRMYMRSEFYPGVVAIADAIRAGMHRMEAVPVSRLEAIFGEISPVSSGSWNYTPRGVFLSAWLAYERGWKTVLDRWEEGDFSRMRPAVCFPTGIYWVNLEGQNIVGQIQLKLTGQSQLHGSSGSGGFKASHKRFQNIFLKFSPLLLFASVTSLMRPKR